MKKVYRPLWSYDVEKTEEWLSGMTEQGFVFDRLNRWTRCFHFQEQKPKKRLYRIVYEKMSSPALPKTLQSEGWEKAEAAGKWRFTSNSQPKHAINTSPVRDGIVKHNRFLTYLFYAMIAYFTAILLNFTIAMFTAWVMEGGSNIVESPLWILTYLFMAFALGSVIFGIYSIVKITQTNRQLQRAEDVAPVTIHQPLDTQKEKELKKAGRLVRKVKFAWIYSPDKMERWLETMGQRGLHLYRVNRIGNVFYFIKGEPRRIAYSIDYQRGPTESYYAIHREAGWQEEFTSFSNMEKWTIWSKIYGETEERPQLYSDQSSRLKHAKRIALTYTAVFSPFVAFYIYFISVSLTRAESVSGWLTWNSSGLMLLAVLIFGTFILRIWSYYGRLKKQAATWSN